MPRRKSSGEDTPVTSDPTWEAAWETEDNYWFENFSGRPYALGPDFYDRFRPAFRYGFESAHHHMGRRWDDAEADLRQGWEGYEHRGTEPASWDEIRDAARDAWERVRGQEQTTEARGPQRE